MKSKNPEETVMSENQCKVLKLHLAHCCPNNYFKTSKSPEEALDKLTTVGKMISAHKPGKALINVFFQQAVRKRINQRPANACTGKRLLISNRSLIQKQRTSSDEVTENQS